MNIDYAKIIERANARKDKLLLLQALLPSVVTVLDDLAEAKTTTSALLAILHSLDEEAQNLVGHSQVRALYQLVEGINQVHSHLKLVDGNGAYRKDASGRSHIETLNRMLERA